MWHQATRSYKIIILEGCVEGKRQHKPFKSLTYEQLKRKLGLIHSDVCSPFQVESVGGSRYLVTFIDDFTKFVSVHFIRVKLKFLKNLSSLK